MEDGNLVNSGVLKDVVEKREVRNPDGRKIRDMKLSGYKGSISNRSAVSDVGEVVRGDTERHYKQKRNDSGDSYGRKKKRKYQEKSIGTSFAELLKGIKLD